MMFLFVWAFRMRRSLRWYFVIWILSLEPLETIPPEWVVAGLNVPKFEGALVIDVKAIVFAETLKTFNHGSFAAYNRTSLWSRIIYVCNQHLTCSAGSLLRRLRRREVIAANKTFR